MKFYPLKIKDLRRETIDCVSIAFEIPDELKAEFQFVQGQYLTLKTTIDGVEVRRSYSLCTSPLEQEWRVAIKKVEDGVFSTYANTVLKKEMYLEVGTPEGRFFSLNNPSIAHPLTFAGQEWIFFATGSGITPILSILKTVLHTHPTSSITLIYGNRSANSVIFREEIEGLKNKFIHRLQVIYVLSRERMDVDWQCGRIDKAKTKVILANIDKKNNAKKQLKDDLPQQHYFICGPETMTNEVIAALEERGVLKPYIHFELFGTTRKAKNKTQKANSDNPITATAHVTLDGIAFDVPMREGDNVLDAALAVGADLPFACKGGVCCTCRAKLLEGAVEMDVNYALDPHEVEAGFILTCQAKPTTPRIVVNFDKV
jgi:ring-1,2-phenylacetyl-CoA epoxidase subunit PaaE